MAQLEEFPTAQSYHHASMTPVHGLKSQNPEIIKPEEIPDLFHSLLVSTLIFFFRNVQSLTNHSEAVSNGRQIEQG